jgi:hypothetical protein
MHRPSSIAILLALTGACSSGNHAQVEAPPVQESTGSATPSEAAAYEVHEWGLLRAEAGDVLRVSAVAPPVQPEMLSVDKPLLYFHTDAPLTLRSVHVATPGGALLETWPYVAGTHAATWTQVRIAHEEVCTPSPLPQANQAPCLGLPPNVFCEAPGLALTRTADAACVHVGDATERFLFYRAEARTYTPPLRFTRRADGEVEVTNEGDAAIPGVLVHIRRENGASRAWSEVAPAPHETRTLQHAQASASDEMADRPVAPSDVEAGRRGIRQTMHELGLTTEEIEAFMRAWDQALFGPGAIDIPPIDVLTQDGRDGDFGAQETVLYFLPESTLSGIATLTFDPPPRALHRALALWTSLPRSGSSR